MYRLPHGEEIPDSLADNHHVIYYKRWYKTTHEKFYRNMSGLVLPMYNPVHKDLHANVPPPLKTTTEFMLNIIDYALTDIEEKEPYPRFLEIVKYIGDVANTSWNEQRVDEATRLYNNLEQQNDYLKQGVVERINDH